jgi:signal peptidase I
MRTSACWWITLLFGYNRGDVVIVRSPIQDIELIKRLIGKPGDVVELRDNMSIAG